MEPGDLSRARILIVDDQPDNVRLLKHILLLQGYTDVVTTSDPCDVVTLFDQVNPDLILLDLAMPRLDGYAVLEQLACLIPSASYVPVLVLTADATPQAKRRALALGARDFLTKPFDRVEVLLRIKNLLETRSLHLQLERQNRELEARVRERTRQLQDAQIETLERLAQAAEFRDGQTGEHTRRVGTSSSLVAQAMGMQPGEVELIRLAAPLHDVGKLGIPDQILLKPGSLTPEEFAHMRRHTVIGARILSSGRSPLVTMAEQIALTHHERWDGRGYIRLAGDQIPLPGRIVAVADVFDALTHQRPYKPAWAREDALAEIRRESGRQFDPSVVDAFLTVVN